MTNTKWRVNAILRESGDNRARLHSIVRIPSNKARQEQRQPYLATQAETTALPTYKRQVPASRKESGHSYARRRSVPRETAVRGK